MIKHEQSPHSAFSNIKTVDGTYYHAKGDYALQTDNGRLIPVNRSYSLAVDGQRCNGSDPGNYKKDFLVHELVSTETVLLPHEELVKIHGKPYLFYKNGGICEWFDSANLDDKRISPQAIRLIDSIQEKLFHLGRQNGYRLGLFGSHRVGLNGVGSDIDLLSWTNEDRPNFVEDIILGLESLGFISIKGTNKEQEYALRYSKRFNISPEAGKYMAGKRIRFISQEGVSLSLQCLHDHTEPETISGFFNTIDSEHTLSEVSFKCEIKNSSLSFNTPKLWKLSLDSGEILPAISFSWMHQGMGYGKEFLGQEHIVKAIMIKSNTNTYLYLRDGEHFILPTKLLKQA